MILCSDRSIFLAVLMMCLPALLPSAALSQDFGPWRALTAEEERARSGDTLSESADPSLIEGDFNGDGKSDKVLIAIRKADGARQLIAVTRNPNNPVELGAAEPDDGLRLAEPGPWDTICGNAFREFHADLCASGYPRQIRLKNPGVLLVGSGQTSLFYWEAKKKRFDTVVLVD